MEPVYREGKTFEQVDFTEEAFSKGEYEQCKFINCNFPGIDLGNTAFAGCTFIGCNLSLALLHKTAFREVEFRDCKMLGLHFEQCNAFGLAFGFDHCQLQHASFYQVSIRKTVFKHTRLVEVDFTGCDLTEAVFDDCDLSGATFDHSILEKADFRKATDYTIDPATNKIKKAKFSLSGLPGLLRKYDIEIDNAG